MLDSTLIFWLVELLIFNSTDSRIGRFIDKKMVYYYNIIMEKYENLVEVIAENLIYYRKKAQLTQSELASKLSYSDKSISKWERAEGVPDIHILVRLANLYGLTVNDFVTKKKKEKIANRFFSRVLITLIALALVWFFATATYLSLELFVQTNDPSIPHWMAFVYAIPVSFIVLIVFTSIYFEPMQNIIHVSGLCWTLAMCLHLTFISHPNISLIYIVAIPFQILIVLFFLLVFRKKRK